jgi:isoleucyl-tRNA synthetase
MIKQVRANYDAPTIEKEIQQFWLSSNAYEKTKEYRSNGERFYFLDGPPYTTGSIHLGTAMNKSLKDIMIRYLRMKGYNVRDQPGFDMHGLPIEVQVEKKIGVHSKKEIEEIGIDKFVDTCKKFANDLRISMTEQFKQLGVWMDWDNPYQTLRLDFIESAWWTVQCAYEKGLLGPANKVVTWCPRCETALAEAEIEYWDETDPSVMVRFPLKDGSGSLLIWTTTPWTLPSNMAVAAHPECEYALIELKGSEGSEKIICMLSQAEYVMKKGKYDSFTVLKKMSGKELEGLEYEPPFDISPEHLTRSKWTYRVLNADYVEKDNTGLVHTAPGFGPDDYETGKRYSIEPFCPVGESGRFTEEFPMMVNKKVKTVNEDIVKYLNEKNILFNSEKVKHRYGHCWRCKSPIIYRNTRQWFINIPEVKDKMLDEIDRVNWVPEWAGESRERNWVEGAREWCVSRQRYWGIPLPVWECQCGETHVVGQYKDLHEGTGYTDGMDTHRPWIDGVTFKCKKCGNDMHRVKDVMDVWFDSGVAAWAQLGYPAKKEEFDIWWPGKFIIEAHDQTRGWFYTQLGAGIVSFDRAPYDEVMMHGWVLDPKGQKMSKSLGNVIEPLEIINELGADSLRLYLVKANAPWEDTAFQKDGPKNARKILNTYWNVVNFASTYMNIDNYAPEAHTLKDVCPYLRNEDKWMLSRTEKVKKAVTEGLETRELHKVARALEDYIMEDLSRWYVRLVRDRSWSESTESENDKIASYFVLHDAIMNAALLLAPIAPHISEEVYQHMGGTKPSVHMEDWITFNDILIDEKIEHSMSLIQNIMEIVAAERAKMGSKLRWPLRGIVVRGNEGINDSIRIFEDVLAQQGNIKEIKYAEPSDKIEGMDAVIFNGGELFIDFSVTPEIEAEGYARELIRRIQQMRKDMKLNVEQYINCDVNAEPHLVELFDTWKAHISAEVRAKKLVFTDSPGGDEIKTWDVTGKDIVIGISSAEQ